MIDNFGNPYPSVNQVPATRASAITTSDTDLLAEVPRAIYVGGAGDIVMVFRNSSTPVTFKAVPVGTVLHVRPIKIMATNTNATFLLALF